MPDMTLAEALALADQDSPLPHLAGQALKVLRGALLAKTIERMSIEVPVCTKAGCNLIGWMPCALPACPKHPRAKNSAS
jgi:hypothetical protein